MKKIVAGFKRVRGWSGFTLPTVLLAGTLMTITAAAALLMAEAQFRRDRDVTDKRQALYAAEMGLNAALLAKKANPGSRAFPFNNNTQTYNLPSYNNRIAQGSIGDPSYITNEGKITRNVKAVCNAYDETIQPEYNSVAGAPAPQPNQPAGGIIPNDDTVAGSYKPIGVWPSSSPNLAPMGISNQRVWLNLDTPNSNNLLATCTKASGSKSCLSGGNVVYMRAQLSVFTVCAPATYGCTTPPCDQDPTNIQIVSIGEVERGEKVHRRAIVADINSPWAFSGLIDKYIDITLMYTTDINGPVHINGLCDDESNRQGCSAFYGGSVFGLPLGVGAGFTNFTSPISVSYPEAVGNSDNIRDDLSGFMETLICDIFGAAMCDVKYIHRKQTVPIPKPQWRTFNDRFVELYAGAGPVGYGASSFGQPDRWLARNKNVAAFSHPNRNDMDGAPATSGGGWTWSCSGPYSSILPDGVSRRWAMGGSKFIRTCAAEAQSIQWNPGTFFDMMNGGTGNPHMAGSEYRNNSLEMENVWVYTGINFDNILGGSCNFSNLGACVGTWVAYPKFGFIGSHRFETNMGNATNAYFIDGPMAMGEPTPWHSCGPNSGGLFGLINWDVCLAIGPWVFFGFTVLPQILIGMPHWHVGHVVIRGEMLVNGELHLNDFIKIEGGSVYAAGLIQKAGSSGLKITFDILQFILQIFKCVFLGCSDLCIPIVNLCLIGDLIYGLLTIFFGSLTITLFEHDISLQIIGGGASIPNSGLLYSKKNFTYQAASSVTFTAIMAILSLNSLLGGFFNFGLGIEIANGRVQLDDGGTIAANGDNDPATVNDGNVILKGSRDIDIQVKNLNGNAATNTVGYVFAKGQIQTQEIGNQYKQILGFDTDETEGTARGVFIAESAFQSRDDCVFNADDTAVSPIDGQSRPGPHYSGGAFTGCMVKYGMDILSDFGKWVQPRNMQIQGYIFAGKIHSLVAAKLIIQKDESVVSDVISRQYVSDPGGDVFNYYEIVPPN